jgi:hypothetical protein
MDANRELDKIQEEIDKLHDRSNNNKIKIATLEATEKERYEHILASIEKLREDMEEMNTSIRALQSLATEGKTSLRTLLWVGGFVAALVSFLLMIYSYIPK